MLHHQSTGSAAFAATVLGDDQHHRKPTCRSAHPHPPGDQLAEWLHGPPLDGFGLLEDGKELPQDYGLSRTLDAGGDSERIAGRHSAGSGVVISTQPPLATFNYRRDILGKFRLALFQRGTSESKCYILWAISVSGGVMNVKSLFGAVCPRELSKR